MVAGSGEPLKQQHPYLHPDSPAPGHFWTSSSVIAFDKLKLTNNRTKETQGQVRNCIIDLATFSAFTNLSFVYFK